jgi:hypothetical protein
LTAREERVTGRADFHTNIALVRRPRLEHVAARADHINFIVRGMNTSLHFVTGNPFETFIIA